MSLTTGSGTFTKRDVIMVGLFRAQHRATVAVYSVLVAHDAELAWRFTEIYEEPAAQDDASHIRALNRFWRDQFCSSILDTANVRVNLIDNVTLQDWIRLFGHHVAPVAVAMDLPQRLDDCAPTERFVVRSSL